MEAARGSLVAFATAPGSVAADGTGRNGTYTKHLLLSLEQPEVEVERVFKRVAQGVSAETRGRQIPWISSSLTGDFYFRSAPKTARERAPAGEEVGTIPIVGVHPVVLQMELSFWDTIKASTMAEDYQDYLNRYPNGQFSGLAQNRLNALRRQQNR
jgi:uncharacterized caspase-like protein